MIFIVPNFKGQKDVQNFSRKIKLIKLETLIRLKRELLKIRKLKFG